MGFLDISSWFRRNQDSLVYEKTLDGSDWYYVSDKDAYSQSKTNLAYALDHPILTPALLFTSNLFAQARFKVINSKTGEEKVNHPITQLLNDPNYYQSRIDFLESLQFLKIAQGKAVIWTKRIIGMDEIDSLYLLRADLITYPKEDWISPMVLQRSRSSIENQSIIYDKDGLNLKIKFRDLIFLFDLPNVANHKNLFETKSRIDGLEQTLKNVYDCLIAKNIILKTNGKEMLSGDSNTGFPFGGAEQEEARQKFQDMYGLGIGRSRLFMTKAKVIHKNLNVPVRDLGFDESIKTDGNIIYTALHIPKDILSLEAKKTTYNNFKESMTSYIQNDIQAMANDVAESFKHLLDTNEELVGSYEHLPIMQFIEIERYQAILGRATALNALLRTGIPEEDALEMVGLPKNMKLNERQDLEQQQAGQQTTETSSDGDGEEGEDD